MFPFKESDELVFQDLMMDDASLLETSNLNHTNRVGKRQQKLVPILEENNEIIMNDNKQKAIIHKEMEKKRREETRYLHTSLRSLLPLEYVKGKRSISDHVQEGVKYIKHLEKNIKELKTKRENLQMNSNSDVLRTSTSSSSNWLPISIKCGHWSGGVEILINRGLREEGFLLSRVLEVLLEKGLDVVSCVSTQVNDRLLHTIQTEVSDTTCIDLSVLQQKLTHVVN